MIRPELKARAEAALLLDEKRAERDSECPSLPSDDALIALDALEKMAPEMAAIIRELLAEVEREGKDAEWQPIESAPRDGTRVLLCATAVDDRHGTLSFRYSTGTWIGDSQSYGRFLSSGLYVTTSGRHPYGEPLRGVSITHWMPLPKPPALASMKAETGERG